MLDFFSSAGGAVTVAVLSWWFGTGLILWLVRLPQHTFRWSMLALSFASVFSLWGTRWSMRNPSVMGAYVGFLSVIVMWSWHEMAFLSGWLTGPRRVVQDSAATGWPRFKQAVEVLLHHELALLGNFALLFAMQWGQPSHLALCTFGLLWCMRVSSKFNLFFGVPLVGDQYLPSHLAYIGSYFRKAPVTLCFYVTVSLSLGTWLWLIYEVQRGLMEINTGWVLLASLLGLAIIEHAMMVLALPLQRLWGWAMGRSVSQCPQVQNVGQNIGAVSSKLPTHPDHA